MERDLKGGEKHSYRINLISGQLLSGLVDQKGIDVSVMVTGPGGEIVVDTDSPNDRWGTEPVLLIVNQSGNYRVDVLSPSAGAAAGRYEIKDIVVRAASPDDHNRASAQRAFDAGLKLVSQRTPAEKRRGVEKYLEALRFFSTAGETYREALTLRAIGTAYVQLNEFHAAVRYLDEAVSLAQGLADLRLEGTLETFLGGSHDLLGNIHEALDHNNRAVKLARQTGNQATEASALNNIGKIYNDMAEWQKALEYYLQALPLFRALGNKRNEGITLNNIGVAYDRAGEHDKGLEYLQQSLPLSRTSGNKDTEAYTLSNIGNAYRSSGEYQKALSYYSQAQTLQKETGNRAQEAETLDSIGVVYAAAGQPQKALQNHEQALQIVRSTSNPRREAISLNNLGHAHMVLGQSDKALEDFNASLTIFRGMGDLHNAATSLEGIARVKREHGDLDESRKRIEESLGLIETVRARSGSQQLRSAYVASREPAYEFYVDLLMHQHLKDPTHGYDGEALQASERGRARSMLELLAEAHVDIRQGVDRQLVDREANLIQSLNAKAQSQIQLTARKGSQEEIAALNKEVSALEDEYQQVQTSIRKISPAYAALTQPQSLTLKEIRQELDPGTLLLEYSLGDARSYLWAVTPDSVKSYELPGRERIQKSAREVYELLTTRSVAKAGETVAQKQRRLTEFDARLLAVSRELSQLVLGPVAEELRTKRLVIVADDALQYVPFAALPVPSVVNGQSSVVDRSKSITGLAATGNARRPTSGYRPLVLDHEIISLPSASALAVQRKNLAARKPAAKAVAVIADPVFSNADVRFRPTPQGFDPLKNQTAGSDGAGSTRIIEHLGEGGGAVIKRLPFTRQEADQILAVAPKAANLKAVDFRASRATATSEDLSHYRYVHFATHGYLDSERPGLSAIVFSLVDEKGIPQDGFLRAHDIYNLNLPAELVVLSACQTGLGKEIKREGVDGLTRGFMYAGARRVVVSLWNVNDKATAELMARFYRGMLRENKTPAAALRTAQIEMSQQTQWRSPYYWAAFVLQGEWK
jgi:CHAT domain-containing protein